MRHHPTNEIVKSVLSHSDIYHDWAHLIFNELALSKVAVHCAESPGGIVRIVIAQDLLDSLSSIWSMIYRHQNRIHTISLQYQNQDVLPKSKGQLNNENTHRKASGRRSDGRRGRARCCARSSVLASLAAVGRSCSTRLVGKSRRPCGSGVA